jgi:alpha-mannosidase
VLTHFPPVDTYNATIVGEEMVFSEGNFKEHGWSDWSLMPYGHGNGGGGPTREMIERARRFADLDGVPRLTPGTTDDFFERVEAEVSAGAPVPVWSGELYFEMHRGTLTSQAKTKVGNRRCEGLLREAELWWASVGAVPAEVAVELDDLWKEVLLQQFHDIIPGSSIAWVYEDAEAAHARVAKRLEALIANALELLAPPHVSIANAATSPRVEVTVLDVEPPRPESAQHLSDGRWAAIVEAAPSGLTELTNLHFAEHVSVTEHSFTTESVAITWNLDGDITSVIDVAVGRELLPVGERIRLELAPDHPVEYDAWDVEAWTRGLGAPVGGVESVRVVESGPLLATLEVIRRFGRSTITQHTTVRVHDRRVDMTFDIDWREDEQLLSLMVPMAVHAREAACDIQFGHVMRPTHTSTSWDAAKFEVCAHRYVHMAESGGRGWGAAVLNDGRYGHGLQDGGVRVSLLRAAKYPDPTQDHGRHQVTIALFLSGGDLAAVVREAECLNVPLRVVPAGTAEPKAPVVRLHGNGVELSAVKRADDGSGDLIVRMAEMCGVTAPVSVRLRGRIVDASYCNLLEEPREGIDVGDGIVAITLRPFQLVTLRLTL